MSCCGLNNNCSCNKCRGIRLSQFPVSDTISAAQQFVLAGNKLVSYSTLFDTISAQIPIAQHPFISIVAASNYTADDGDDAIRVVGSQTITIPLGRNKPITVYAADSLVTLSLTPENVGNTIVSGNSVTLFPIGATGYYAG